ncbi:MAG TPA: mannose-6-phosphate isomerase, class I [Membranihabitans sp.]|nr:mannose-6-phosphate isomerase, class I [Membranihabitans sp.]
MEIIGRDAIWKIKGCVQNYPWGGKSYIPDLICEANEEDLPFAELWFGQHPVCPSMTTTGSSLDELMAVMPELILTAAEQNTWGNQLPFLCKILDVKSMLSIQIHPTKEQAMAGFEQEEAEGIPMTAPHRTFRDRNHKPELMFALSEFYLLHNFRSDSEIRLLLSNISELRSIYEVFIERGLDEFYRWLMDLDQATINQLLGPFVEELRSGKVFDDMTSPEYWINQAIDQYCTADKIDRGILSFYLMNIVRLQPGEVIFQDSGIPHAYLRGQNVEIMASSDNVIRGGLTSKFINSSALSNLVRFDSRSIFRLTAEVGEDGRRTFSPPVEEFRLSVINLTPSNPFELQVPSVSLLFSTCNCFKVASPTQDIRVGGGEALLVRAGSMVKLRSRGAAQIFIVQGQR